MYNLKIVNDILVYVDECGWGKYGWYVGIATDIEKRLFSDHNVNKESEPWIYKLTNSENEARETEKELLARLSFKGGPGGGDKPLYVYAYKITPDTKE